MMSDRIPLSAKEINRMCAGQQEAALPQWVAANHLSACYSISFSIEKTKPRLSRVSCLLTDCCHAIFDHGLQQHYEAIVCFSVNKRRQQRERVPI